MFTRRCLFQIKQLPSSFQTNSTSTRFYCPHRTYKVKTPQVIVVTSGKGGVGKTTTAASIGYGLAEAGFRTCVIDFDVGLRNLDIHFVKKKKFKF